MAWMKPSLTNDHHLWGLHKEVITAYAAYSPCGGMKPAFQKIWFACLIHEISLYTFIETIKKHNHFFGLFEISLSSVFIRNVLVRQHVIRPGRSDDVWWRTLIKQLSSPCCQDTCTSLLWRYNGCDDVSNHQRLDCLLNHLFRRRSMKTTKLRVTALCEWNPPGTGEFTAQMASKARKMFPFNDVFMCLIGLFYVSCQQARSSA